MNFLIDIGHPAHVHLFKHARAQLIGRGHEVWVVARDKEVTRQLLHAYDIPYIPGTRKRPGWKRAFELLEWGRIVSRAIRAHDIDLVFSFGSPAGAWAARVSGIAHVAFNDTETAIEQRVLYARATEVIYTPRCLLGDFGPKQVRYDGLHDLAYLRPEHFQADPSVREALHVASDEAYAVVRWVEWDATHDWLKKGTTRILQREVVDTLSQSMKVFISAECKLPQDLEALRIDVPPHRIHDVMAGATMMVGDSGSMLTEAAVLGIPALHISAVAKKVGALLFLEGYGLLGLADSADEGMHKLRLLLQEDDPKTRSQARQRLLDDTIDVAEFIADQCEAYAASSVQHSAQDSAAQDDVSVSSETG